MKKLRILILAIGVMGGFASCNDDSTPNYEVAADVFIETIYKQVEEEQVPHHAAIYSVSALTPMESVKTTTPGGEEDELEKYEGSSFVFANDVEDADYVASLPELGSYSFDVKFKDGEEKSATNSLDNDFVLPSRIRDFSIENGILKVKFNKVDGADGYMFKVVKKGDSEDVVLIDIPPFEIAEGKDFFENSYSLSNFDLVAGDVLLLEVRSLLFESEGTIFLQAMGISSQTLVIP